MCEVSRRTIYRDLEILAAAGVPVRYVPERQGYQLISSFVFPHAGLDEEEVRALILLCQPGRAADAHGIHQKARRAALKLAASLRPDTRERVQALAEWVQVRTEAVDYPPERTAVYDRVLSGLAERKQLRLWYRDRETLASSSTKVSPFRLVIDGPKWYLIGRSTLHRTIKVFPLPWIERVESTDEKAMIPPRFDLERFLGRAWAVERGKHVEVRLRFTGRAAPDVREHKWHLSQRIEERDDGGVDVCFSLDGDQEVIGWILSYGDQVEVIAPSELRTRMWLLCRRMARRHEQPIEA
jgi:proteasome accessory factor B